MYLLIPQKQERNKISHVGGRESALFFKKEVEMI